MYCIIFIVIASLEKIKLIAQCDDWVTHAIVVRNLPVARISSVFTEIFYFNS